MYEILFYLLKRVLISFCLASLITISLNAQNHKIDSLKILSESKTDTVRYEALWYLAIEYAAIDNLTALNYAIKSRETALEIGDTIKIISASRITGQLYVRLDRSKEAIEVFSATIPIAKRKNQRRDIKIMLNGLATSYVFQAEYDKALEANFQSLVLREEDGDPGEIGISLHSIGLVYYKMKNFQKALEYYNRSLQFKNQTSEKYHLDRLLVNIGLCYVSLANYSEAKKVIRSGLKTCGNDCDKQVKLEGEYGLGVSNFGLNDLNEAEKNFSASLAISSEVGNRRFQAENILYLGKVAVRRNDFQNAITFLTKAESISDSSGYNQLLIDVFKEFSSLYNKSEDYKNASIYQKKYISLKDSLIGEGLVKNIAKIQTNFEERENLATIKLKEEALVRQRNLNIAVGVIAILAGLLIFVLYRSVVVTRRVNTALSDAKTIIEKQNFKLHDINRDLDAKVKDKTADLLKANDELDKANISLSQVNGELDNFIYKTSHDIRGPLASLKGICSVALMDVKDPLALDYFQKLDASSGRLNVILTRLLIVNQINNAVVGKELIDFDAIVDDVMLLEKKKGLPQRFEIQRDIQKDLALHSDKDLVRIILENLIDNAIKFHNDSPRVNPFVHIKISAENKRVIVSVIDNGIGIAEVKPDKIFQMFSRASERSGTGGIGLYLSKLATEKLGGEIHLRNTREGYTEFYVSFPYMA